MPPPQKSKMKRTHAHYRQTEDGPVNMQREVEAFANAKDPRSLVPLSKEGVLHISKYYVPVRTKEDLALLPSRLPKDKEFGFSPLFDPKLVDETCKLGIFPLAIEIADNFFIYAPKIHVKRCVCALTSDPVKLRELRLFPDSSADVGEFDPASLHPSKKLVKPPNQEHHTKALDVFVNRPEDLSDVFALIRAQHGESWFCGPLRQCFAHMLWHPELYSTRVVITAVRRHAYGDNNTLVTPDEAKEGELVACEVGYIVGDIYSSATGGYCVSGAGSLQLALTGIIMKALGCTVWDLGMAMEYKTDALKAVEITRKKWMDLVGQRLPKTSMTDTKLVEKLRGGVPVSTVLSPVFLNTLASA